MWIKGKALETLLALRGLQAGDTVMVRPTAVLSDNKLRLGWPDREPRKTKVVAVRTKTIFAVKCPCGKCPRMTYDTSIRNLVAWKAPRRKRAP